MSAHTPGPWMVSSTYLVCDSEARVIAQCQPIGVPALDIPVLVAASNGRLIAAAPELLYALMGMVRQCESEGWPIKAEHLAILAQARAAIAKAAP